LERVEDRESGEAVSEELERIIAPYRDKVEEFNRQGRELEDELNKTWGHIVKWHVPKVNAGDWPDLSWIDLAGMTHQYQPQAKVRVGGTLTSFEQAYRLVD
jgi:hypothetical protein